MSIQFILGSSGSGKSYQLYQEIVKSSIANPKTNYLVVVPEQFTMQTQRDMVAAHRNHGIMNIDILSFMRLAYRVFDELGGNDRIVLEDTGKSMILRKVVEQKKGDLTLFQGNVHRQGFISELKSMLSEVYQYSIKEEQLQELIGKVGNKPVLQNKLKDILTIYQGFKEYLSERYITTEEILDVLYDSIDNSQYIKESVICFDGFTGFTPSQYKLLTKLMHLSQKVIVTVTIDEREDFSKGSKEHQLFHLSRQTIGRLEEIAANENVRIEKPVWIHGVGVEKIPYRFKESKGLAALERNLFRFPWTKYEKEVEDISIHVAKDPASEVAFTMMQIRRLVREEGYRYKDIAVVTGDIATYGRIIERDFEVQKIPYFIDSKKGILANPCVEMVRAVIDIICKDYSYEAMFRYLRLEFVDITKEEVDILENYVLALGIRGHRLWEKDWDRNYRTKEPIDFIRLNEARKKAIAGLAPLREILRDKNATVAQMTTAIYEFLREKRVQFKLEEYSSFFGEQGLLALSKEYKQIYRFVIELFEKMVELLGDEILPVSEYGKLLDSGFEEIKVGIIPPSIDQIVVGDIERTRLKDIKALFFIGVNDGIIPKSSDPGGIISDMERQVLADHKIELAPTKRQRSYTEQFYLYLNMTKPNHHLFITYCKVGMDGKTRKASYMISKLKQIFPLLKVKEYEEQKEDLDYILSNRQGIEFVIEGIKRYCDTTSVDPTEPDPTFQELYSWYCNDPDRKAILDRVMEGAFYSGEEHRISKAVASALYGNELSGSVTRLEKYAACAFSHFVSYGLELMERQEYRLAVPDIGNIFHKAIDLFSKKVEKSEYSWKSIPAEVRDAYAEDSVKEAAVSYGNNVILSSKRNEYMLERVKRITKRTIWALCEHVRKGAFEPKGYELQFSFLDHLDSVNIPLTDTQRMHLQGRIDRVDIYEEPENNRILVKVIDYKSGHSALDMGQVYYGLQLQLAVYLSASLELQDKLYQDRKVEPAGIFYYNIDDPIVDKTDHVEQAILKELKMNGLVNADMNVAKYMDTSFMNEEGSIKPSVKSDVIPIETNKDGYPTKRSSIASTKQFKEITDYVNGKVIELGREILEGTTSVNPYQLGDRTACDYCNYQGICGFDVKLPGNRYRRLKKFDKDVVFEMLGEQNLHEEETENSESSEYGQGYQISEEQNIKLDRISNIDNDVIKNSFDMELKPSSKKARNKTEKGGE
ncbi:MAG TPA: helicase-exonuclease AddAB subunit AddB [Lachnospiraceae bacterium]|nr:helicase-exonuclease AddAB subunit AddB [Lachnospiraceae bacterium]